MTRQAHPTHDREQIRSTAACCLGIAASFVPLLVSTVFSTGSAEWPSAVAVVGFVACCGGLCFAPINTTSCPTCGRRLRRPEDTTEFECEPCQTVWTTRCYGGGLLG